MAKTYHNPEFNNWYRKALDLYNNNHANIEEMIKAMNISPFECNAQANKLNPHVQPTPDELDGIKAMADQMFNKGNAIKTI